MHPYVHSPTHPHDAYTDRATLDIESVAPVDPFSRELWWHHAPMFQAQPAPPKGRTM